MSDDQMHLSNHEERQAIARLANVAGSQASPAITTAATALLRILAEDHPVDEHEFGQASHALAEAIAAMPGSTATHAELLAVLHGREPQLTQHRLRNVSAALRNKAARLGRPLVETDFPAGHPVPLFALAYWGGVETWSAGSADRVQRPTNFWTDRENQISAIRDLAARHPGCAITHARLHEAGLHRLAQALCAVDLTALTEAAGLDRNLQIKPPGWWTAERVVDAYAAACREAGVTLSTTALAAIGGGTSTLRCYAQKYFAAFGTFQRAVVARHPDITLPDRPTARDGTLLDSWAEVVVHNALRLALPDASIAHHVVLAGEMARSADFVIAGIVWVEVLGIARQAMATPSSKRQAKYATQWITKAALYEALGIDPVVIEPDDVHDTARLANRIAEIAEKLRCTPVPPEPARREHTRSKGSWTFDALCAAVAQVANGSATFPTFEALAQAGFGHARMMLRAPGMRGRISSALRLADPNRKNVWKRDRVVTELAVWVRRQGSYPSAAQLRQSGQGALNNARARLWRGEAEVLRAAVGKVLGHAVQPVHAPAGSYATPMLIAALLTPLANELGRMPTGREATAAGVGVAWDRASRGIGVAKIAALIGVSWPGRQVSRAEMLGELGKLSAATAEGRLTTTIVRARLGGRGIAWVRRCGGIAAVRTAIGVQGGGEVGEGGGGRDTGSPRES